MPSDKVKERGTKVIRGPVASGFWKTKEDKKPLPVIFALRGRKFVHVHRLDLADKKLQH